MGCCLTFQLCLLILLLREVHSSSSSFSSNSTSHLQLCPHHQTLALLHFKNIFSFNASASDPDFCGDESYPKMQSWEEGTDCCLWDGVTCNRMIGHVIGLDLSCSQLYGTLHSNSTLFLLDLPHLQTLNLAFNDFRNSRISPHFGRFPRLKHLNLSNSQFSGNIPSEIMYLSKLISLDLSCYYGGGNLRLNAPNLKGLVQNLTELRQLHLDQVNMSMVQLGSLRNLSSSLASLSLRECELRGKFPNDIFGLPNLRKIRLAFNSDLIGYLPKLNWSSSLEMLDLVGTGFFGEVPDSIGNLQSLNYLDLWSCNFSGSIPASLGNLTKITRLGLGYNHFTGEIPSSLSNLSQLQKLGLSNININAHFPSFIFNLTQLSVLVLSNCQLMGPIPSLQLPNLELLELSDNSLNGTIPSSVFSVPLRFLDLSNNEFTGQILMSIFQLKNLTNLDLSNNQLTGQIPMSISQLKNLTDLDLSNNQLTGQIPMSISQLKNLTDLELSNNQLTGQIPMSISQLKNLTDLDLSNNQLTGQIPMSISQLKNLTDLELSNNQLTGQIPMSISQLKNLTYLDLSNNQLTGQIPMSISQLKNLTCLDLSNNQLTGQIPMSISQLKNLNTLRLSSNNLSGIVELQEFSKLQNLGELYLSYNSLSLSTDNNVNYTLPKLQYLEFSSCNLTEFPNFLRNQDTLHSLDLSHNKIQGSIPKWVRDMGLYYLNLCSNYLTSVEQLPWKNLQYLNLHSNLLQGEIPSSICNVSFLDILDLSNNNLSGVIPKCLGNFSNSLTVLDLRMNSFHGSIPRTFKKGNRLRNIALNGNQLEGSVPRSLINCRNLEVLDLGNNKINDTFPHWLETLPELHVFVLRSNRFHGSISSSKAKHSFPKLRILDLSNNYFNGPLPVRYFKNLKAMMNVNEVGTKLNYMGDSYYQDSVILMIKGLELKFVRIITTLTTIDLSNNSFQGEIPKSIGKLNSLRVLNFSHNNLMGHIPTVLENLRVLESLDLSSNNIIGEIPGQLTSLTFLAVLNLSQNHLVGRIPQGNQFNTFQNDSYFGNWGLCGVPLSKKCNYDEASSPPQMVVQEEEDLAFTSGFGWKVVLMGYGCGMIFGMVMGYLMFLTGKPKRLVRIIEGEILKVVKWRNRNAHRRGRKRIYQIQAAFLGTGIKGHG